MSGISGNTPGAACKAALRSFEHQPVGGKANWQAGETGENALFNRGML